ncbi:phage tail protein [Streptomyces sp. NPDC048270]|uniref:phage tail protein n=1 Tax=Streptomyces sp. NPDC048270 TaxID=3154615 RepID=UPI0033C8E586
MRAAIEGLGSPYSLVQLLPSVYQDDPFSVRLTAGWDEVIAPVINTLDCLDSYIDPRLAPEDFLVWLADRMGTQLNEDWPLDRKRAATAHAVQGHRTRGTVEGLRERIALATGGQVELWDAGGVFTSPTPETSFPEGLPSVAVVRVTVEREQDGDPIDLEALVRECVPAHVPYRMEVVRR